MAGMIRQEILVRLKGHGYFFKGINISLNQRLPYPPNLFIHTIIQ